MATKKITVSIDDMNIGATIRRIKKKEMKTVLGNLAEKCDELIELFDKPDIVRELPGLIKENIDFVCDVLILPFTSITAEQLDEMDVVDVLALGKELLAYNGVATEKIINFLKPEPATKQKIAEALNFNGISSPSLY